MMDRTVRNSPSQEGNSGLPDQGSRPFEDRDPGQAASAPTGPTGPNSTSTGSSTQTEGSGAQSFTTAYSDSDGTVRGGLAANTGDGRPPVYGNPNTAGPRRPASNVDGTGSEITPPSPTPLGGPHWDGMVFHATDASQERLGRYQTAADLSPPLADPLGVRGAAVSQAAPQASHPAVLQPHPQAPYAGIPRWDGNGMPPSVSSDPFRIYPNTGHPTTAQGPYMFPPGPPMGPQGYAMPPPGYPMAYGPQGYPMAYAPQGYPMLYAPTTGYAESLYGPAVTGVPGDQRPRTSPNDRTETDFRSHTVDDSLRVIKQAQEGLHNQIRGRTEQIGSNVQEADRLALMGKSIVLEYMTEVDAMRSRMNRIAADNAEMLKDVERGLSTTNALMNSSVPLSSSTPRPHHRQSTTGPPPPLAQWYPPPSPGRNPARTTPVSGVPGATGVAQAEPSVPPAPPDRTNDIPNRDTPPHLTRSGPATTDAHRHNSVVRSPDETIDQYNHRVDVSIRSQKRVQDALQANVASAVDRVHFAQREHVPRPSPRDGPYPTTTTSPITSKPKAFRLPQGPPISRAFPAYPPVTHNYTDRDPIVPLSMVGRSNPGAVEVVGHLVDSDGHREVMLVQLCENIRFKTEVMAPPLPPGAKYPKFESPGKYDGADDHDAFYNWLDGYLTWLRFYNVCGPETDRSRVQYLRPYLTGKAVEWYTVCIDNPSLGYLPTFEETICAMHRRFVHSSSAAKATLDFDNCRYRS